MATAVKAPVRTEFSIPGPPRARLLGATGNVIQFANDPLKYLGDAFQRYGSVVSLVEGGGTRIISPFADCPGTVFINTPDLNRQLITQSEIFEKSAIFGLRPADSDSEREKVFWNWGTGLFHVNGNDHKQHRRLLMPAFHKRRIETYRDDMVAITNEVLDAWTTHAPVDVKQEMTLLTLRIAGKTLFGYDVRADGDDSISTLLGHIMHDFRNPLNRWLPYDIPGLPYHQLRSHIMHTDQKLRRLTAEKRARGTDDGDVLAMLIQARDEDGTTLTEDEIIGHAVIIFLAGHETSANALTWTLLALSQFPDIAAELLDELDGALHGEPPTIEQIGQLTFLENVIKESLRILPPVPMNHRLAGKPLELDGCYIPQGTEVLASIYHLQHDPDIFPQPETFNPHRWEAITPSAFEYNPFSAGPRMCIGAPFAMLEIKLVLATLLQRYRLEALPNMVVNPLVRITMSPKKPLPMMVRNQDREFGRGVGNVSGRLRDLIELPN